MPEILIGKYMQAVRQPLAMGRKTHMYLVQEKKTGGTLGAILWYGPWRSYVYNPKGTTVYDRGCLKQLAEWCTTLTDVHKRIYSEPSREG